MIYDNLLGIFNHHVNSPLEIEDIPATIGTGLLVAASLIAIIAVLFYVAKRDLSKPEAYMTIRMVLVCEIGYFLLFWPSIYVEGFPGGFHFTLMKVAELTVPCLVEAILIPVVLTKLFLELNPSKPAAKPIKWGLISGTAYLFVFWLNNSGNWIGTLMEKGVDYIIQFPLNMFSFILTTVGLFLLALYTGYFSKKSTQSADLTLSSIDLKKAGLIITSLGTYLLLLFLLYLFFGAAGGWSEWWAWFLGHGYLDLWALTLPFVGLCLLFTESTKLKVNKVNKKRFALSNKQINLVIFLTQALGMIFYIVFSAAYDIPLPSTKVLTGEPIFHNLLMISGVLYFIFILLTVGLSAVVYIKD